MVSYSRVVSCLFIACVDCVTLALEVVGLKHPPRAVLLAPILHRAKLAGDDLWSEENREVITGVSVVVAGDASEVVFCQLCCGCVHVQVVVCLFVSWLCQTACAVSILAWISSVAGL